MTKPYCETNARARLMVLTCALWIVWSTSSPVLAQVAAASDTSEYRELVQAALVEFDGGRFEEARVLFLKAHEQQPSARTLRALGNVEFELRRYVECVTYLEAALASSERALTQTMRDETARTLARAWSFVGRYSVQIAPSTAVLSIDGDVPKLHTDGSLLLNMGRHELALSAAGHEPLQRVISVRGGERETLVLSLVQTQAQAPTPVLAQPGPQPTAAASPAAPTVSPSVFERWWFWTAVSVVVVGAGAGVIAAAASGGSQTEAALPGNLGATRSLLHTGP